MKIKTFIYILAASFMIGFAFIIITTKPMAPDSYFYDTTGWNMAQGSGYVEVENKATMEREPLYSCFLVPVYIVFGHKYFPVQIIQLLLFLFTAILTYKIGRMVFNEELAVYSLIFTAFFPTLANYPSYILSETLFTFLLALFVFYCMKIYYTNKAVYYFLSGVVLGLLALCKAIMLPFIFVLVAWLVFVKLNAIHKLKFIIRIFIMTICFMVFVVPWAYRNYVKFGNFSLREGSEIALAIKAQKLNFTVNDFKENIVFILSERLGKKMFPNAVDNPNDFLFKEDYLVKRKMIPELVSRGYNSKEIRNMMIAKISERPFKYIAISCLDLLKMTQFTYIPVLVDQDGSVNKINIFLNNNTTAVSLLRGLFRVLAYILIICSFTTMWIKRRLWRNWLFVALVILYTNLMYSLVGATGRYGVPLIPLYVILSTPVILSIKKKYGPKILIHKILFRHDKK